MAKIPAMLSGTRAPTFGAILTLLKGPMVLAFGLSGFSEALDSFNGGDGRLGLHGTDDPTSIGSDSTHGCIRLTNDAIVQLAETVPLGTPVAIFS